MTYEARSTVADADMSAGGEEKLFITEGAARRGVGDGDGDEMMKIENGRRKQSRGLCNLRAAN